MKNLKYRVKVLVTRGLFERVVLRSLLSLAKLLFNNLQSIFPAFVLHLSFFPWRVRFAVSVELVVGA